MRIDVRVPQQPLAKDCRHWRSDRPCVWHKREGLECVCHRYDPVRERILIVKLDAMGDVLRSTCVLPGLRERHAAASIDWITRSESVPLFRENPLVDRVIPYGADALLALAVGEYDHVINLDAARTSCELATIAKGKVKTGFILSPAGHVEATNAEAESWLRMGVSDVLKKRNARTYQEIMGSILGLPAASLRYVFHLASDEVASAARRLRELGVREDVAVVGLATGAGGRWPLKQWREEGFAELIEQLRLRFAERLQVVLLGGPEEKEKNARLRKRFGDAVVDTGCDNPVRQFAGLLRGCDVVVTGDTLAMHLALAQQRRTAVLFGPTSYHEIELFGLGEKIYPSMDCLGCYLTACDKKPNCMQEIKTSTVFAAVVEQLERARPGFAS